MFPFNISDSVRTRKAKATGLAVLCLALASSCGGGSDVVNVLQGGTFNGGSARDVELSKQSLADLCCGVTIVSSTDTVAQTRGCGKETNYAYTNSKWTPVSQVSITGWGSAADQVANCTPIVIK